MTWNIGIGGVLCAATLSVAGAAAAQTLDCQQTRISKGGFTTLSAAQSFFPESQRYVINGDRVRSEFYGNGYVSTKGDRTILTFPIALQDGTSIDINMTWIRKNNRYSIRFASGAGYEQVKGAAGQCAVRG
ncbi:MAG: hypothetical protein AAGB05_18680 [Pseudomonadota bacterium]